MEIIFNIFHVEYNTSTRNIDVYGCVRYAIKLIGVEGEISYFKKQSMLSDLRYATSANSPCVSIRRPEDAGLVMRLEVMRACCDTLRPHSWAGDISIVM